MYVRISPDKLRIQIHTNQEHLRCEEWPFNVLLTILQLDKFKQDRGT